MSIRYIEDQRMFVLSTPNTSYVMALVDEEGFLGHVYYGRKLNCDNLLYLLRTEENPFVPSRNERERASFMDCFNFEYPGFGVGDYRTPAFAVRNAQGAASCGLAFESYEIVSGKPALAAMPATFGSESEVDTLIITCIDGANNLRVKLFYSVFADTDAIARHVEFENVGSNSITLTRALSMSMDMDNEAFDTIVLHGSWARERHIDRTPLGFGTRSVCSFRGESSHQEHPFLALAQKGADEDHGDVYGFNFVYSGNFLTEAQRNQFETVRVNMGINPEGFAWSLGAGETFVTPEVICVYSAEGIGAMTRSFHRLYKNHLIRSKYKDQKRPILINNWEATYFNFDTDKLLSIAREASSLGIEMLVMDDGWFGKRNSDNCALGDWVVNEDKLQGGLKNLVDQVNAMGMKFGIWFEPEMISPDSDLYRAHPDYAVAIPGRMPAQSRQQYVLDITRPEVRDYAYNCVKKILESANIAYVKWDMNRQLTDMYSLSLAPEHQGEFFHRYVLAVYEMQERLVTDFPDLLLENCSGGGARFDPGMLYYSPQIWTSDDTDAIERLEIQQGTAMVYPLSCMGAHVSDCPNHTVGRVTPFETRGIVALAGTFGYELDVTKIPQSDRDQIPGQVAMYHKYNDLVRQGEYYRLASYADNRMYDAWMVIAEDQSEALVTYVQVMAEANFHSKRLCLKGLDPEKLYRIEETGMELTGAAMMYAGIPLARPWGDFRALLIHLTEVK